MRAGPRSATSLGRAATSCFFCFNISGRDFTTSGRRKPTRTGGPSGSLKAQKDASMPLIKPQETPRAFNTGPRGPRDGPKRPPRRPKMGSKTVLSELPGLESNATIFLYKWSHHFRVRLGFHLLGTPSKNNQKHSKYYSFRCFSDLPPRVLLDSPRAHLGALKTAGVEPLTV